MVEESLKPLVIPVSGKLVTAKDPLTLGEGDFQELTNMRYKRKNPVSIMGMTKFNTATVVDGTASPGTYMKTRQGFHFRKDTPTDMGRDTSGNGDDDDPSDLFPELIGWYKVDETTGTTLFNSANPTDPADKLPDLTLIGNSTYFWATLSGFGTCGIGANACYGEYSNATAFYTVTETDDMGVFVRIIGKNSTYPFIFTLATTDQHSWETHLYCPVYGSGSRIAPQWFFGGIARGSFTASAPVLDYDTILNRWMFFFSSYEDGVYKIKCVQDDGTLLVGATTTSGSGISADQIKIIRMFMSWNGAYYAYHYINGQVADAMYFTGKRLTMSEWAQVYDLLRGRYSMSARSGWG